MTGTCDRWRGLLEVRHPVTSAPQLTLPGLPGMVQPMAVYRYPRTSEEFEQRFASEEACRDYLANLRWCGGFQCPRCACTRGRPTPSPGFWFCVRCQRPVSVTARTIFQDRHCPLTLWLKALWLITSRDGVSAARLQRELRLGSYRTAWTWLDKFRRAMVRSGPAARLAGDVEVQATTFFVENFLPRGRRGSQRIVIAIAVEGEGRQIRMRRIPNRSARSLRAFVREAVARGP